jgi:hypothetical protein
MLIPLDKNALVEYSLISDTSDTKTIFKLGYLNSRQKAALTILSKKSTKETDESSMWWFPLCKLGIKGWTNINKADGTPYEFKSEKLVVSGFGEFDAMSDECFEAFTLDIIAELAMKLYEINYIPDTEKKT